MTEENVHWEHAKLALRHHYPDEEFILTCAFCGCTWPAEAEMGMVTTHFQISHDDANVQLNLVYIGSGDAPEESPQ